MSISKIYSYQMQMPQNVMFKAEQPVTVVPDKAQPPRKDEKMSMAAKYMIGLTALAAVMEGTLLARKGGFGKKVQNFFKTSSELKAEAEKKAKAKAEKEAKEKAEKAAREAKEKAEQRVKETKITTTTSNNNASFAETNTKSSASTKQSSGTSKGSSSNSSGTTHTSSRKRTSGESNYTSSSSHTTNTASTTETTQNVTRETKSTVKPNISPELVEQLKFLKGQISAYAENGIKAEFFVKDGEIQAKYSATENMCKRILAEMEDAANSDNSMSNDVKQKILKEMRAVIRQDIQTIKASGNPETAINEFNARLQKYYTSEMEKSIQKIRDKYRDLLPNGIQN